MVSKPYWKIISYYLFPNNAVFLIYKVVSIISLVRSEAPKKSWMDKQTYNFADKKFKKQKKRERICDKS